MFAYEYQMPVSSISVVVTAPHGIADCDYLDDLLAKADGRALEIVVADASPNYVDQSRVGLVHVRATGCGIQGLISEGIRRSSCDWVVVTEDHCRTLRGFIENYREAVEQNPEIDLFSGAVDNLTSASPWASAIFIFGLHQFWPQIAQPPRAASNANLMVCRRAILASELAVEGGLLNISVPRLIKSGRYKHCPAAIVDHVLDLSSWQAVKFEFNCAAGARTVYRELSQNGPIKPAGACRDYIRNAVIVPVRIIRRLRGTSQSGLGTALRLMLLGFTAAVATLTVDLRRLVRNAPGTVEAQDAVMRVNRAEEP